MNSSSAGAMKIVSALEFDMLKHELGMPLQMVAKTGNVSGIQQINGATKHASSIRSWCRSFNRLASSGDSTCAFSRAQLLKPYSRAIMN